MSLITRCPACGTMFKVVTDQLKVSQGWVRCGHCSEVFDATLHLQTVQPEQEQVSTPKFDHELPPFQQQPESQGQALWSPGAFLADQRHAPPVPASDVLSPAADTGYDVDPSEWKQSVPLHPGDGQESMQSVSADAFVQDSAIDSRNSGLDDPASELNADLPDEAHNLSFVRNARRQAFWRKPPVRVVLGLLCILLAALLLLQLVIQQRDTVAALEPRLKPLLQTVCAYLQCEIGPVRRIESVVIDSSSFNKINASSYRLGFSLKNTGTMPVAMPSLEVTLTDTQDQPLARRVLTPGQFGAAGNQLVAGSDFAGLVVIQVLGLDGAGALIPGAGRVAGYRVLAFYP